MDFVRVDELINTWVDEICLHPLSEHISIPQKYTPRSPPEWTWCERTRTTHIYKQRDHHPPSPETHFECTHGTLCISKSESCRPHSATVSISPPNPRSDPVDVNTVKSLEAPMENSVWCGIAAWMPACPTPTRAPFL